MWETAKMSTTYIHKHASNECVKERLNVNVNCHSNSNKGIQRHGILNALFLS